MLPEEHGRQLEVWGLLPLRIVIIRRIVPLTPWPTSFLSKPWTAPARARVEILVAAAGDQGCSPASDPRRSLGSTVMRGIGKSGSCPLLQVRAIRSHRYGSSTFVLVVMLVRACSCSVALASPGKVIS